MNDIDQRADVFNGRLRENSVTQVEDMTRATACLRQDAPGLGLDFMNGREQHDRVEIALNGHARPQSLPALIELDSPIEADDRTAGVAL